jgi:hypothetical protein
VQDLPNGSYFLPPAGGFEVISDTTFTPINAPEPCSVALIGGGIVTLLVRRPRRRMSM